MPLEPLPVGANYDDSGPGVLARSKRRTQKRRDRRRERKRERRGRDNGFESRRARSRWQQNLLKAQEAAQAGD